MLETAAAGYASFGAWAPGWSPPAHDLDLRALERRLAGPETWSAVALVDGKVVGHAITLPARLHPRADPDPGLVHLGGLFVRPVAWGGGAAPALLAAAAENGAGRGFTGFRLFTPALHARARRFYEREGWAAAGDAFGEPLTGLEHVEYRRALP